MMNSLKIRNINKQYKNFKALENINLDIEENKIYGLLGNNGAGKSTLLNIINNRIYSTSGSVELDDENAFNNETVQNNIFLMSEVDLYEKRMTIKKIFKWTKAFYGDFNYDLANQMVRDFNVDVNKRIGALSTGYRSICKLIVALCVPCKYIFLDEPVLGLDAKHRQLFYNVLIESYVDKPRTFVISTHLIEEISNLLEHIIIIEQGQIILNQPLDNLYSDFVFISGNRIEIESYTNDEKLKIIGGEYLGDFASVLVLVNRDDIEIPSKFKQNSFDLQKLFLYLSERKEENHENISSNSI
ncbi:ABC transporter ATP-binding protein [Staphylococcus succinus]|nr:ABC transporter ATP-binding protein [Staphylococcus succinus]